MDFFVSTSMLAIWLIIARSLLPYNPVKNSLYKILMESVSVMEIGLKGIVYAGDFHYTSRVCANGLVWFHDGMVTGRSCTYEGKLNVFTDSDLSVCNGKTSSLLYMLKNNIFYIFFKKNLTVFNCFGHCIYLMNFVYKSRHWYI